MSNKTINTNLRADIMRKQMIDRTSFKENSASLIYPKGILKDLGNEKIVEIEAAYSSRQYEIAYFKDGLYFGFIDDRLIDDDFKNRLQVLTEIEEGSKEYYDNSYELFEKMYTSVAIGSVDILLEHSNDFKTTGTSYTNFIKTFSSISESCGTENSYINFNKTKEYSANNRYYTQVKLSNSQVNIYFSCYAKDSDIDLNIRRYTDKDLFLPCVIKKDNEYKQGIIESCTKIGSSIVVTVTYQPENYDMNNGYQDLATKEVFTIRLGYIETITI